MKTNKDASVEAARDAALQVLQYNADRSDAGLMRTAGWGYPEPYTRDVMMSAPGLLISGDRRLVDTLRRTLRRLAGNQTKRGLIPGLADDPEDLGSSDTTPLFLIGLALYRLHSGERDFLGPAARKALRWMEYQSPDDRVLVAQQPTSDWRDEQWVEGYGLYVNSLHYIALRLHGRRRQAETLRSLMNCLAITANHKDAHVHEGLQVAKKPYYALWSLKVHTNQRFDLVGNSLAILAGVPSRSRARAVISWTEKECRSLRENGLLAVDLPPNLLPYIEPEDTDWRRRYQIFNRPGEYHNGGVWPFACALYVAAQVAAGRFKLARRSLGALTRLITLSRREDLDYGFNEWIRAQDGAPGGQDWQTWSAALYLYAAACVERGTTPFFDRLRRHWDSNGTG